jgi:hypothetical protein
MKLTEKKTSTFQPHPETDGPIKAVIVDVTEPKSVQTKFGEKEMFRLVFETEMVDEENNRNWCIWSRNYTPSLNEKASFRKDLKRVMGRELTKNELDEGFDTEILLGMGVKLIVQHEESPDGEKTYANISFLTNDPNPMKPTGGYTRQRDRDKDGDDKPAPAKATAKASKPAAKATSWEDCIIHIGKHKGKTLGSIAEEDVQILIDKWLPKAGASAEDQSLAAALQEIADLLATSEDY